MESVMIDHKEVSIDRLLNELEHEIARLESMIEASEAELAALRRARVA